MEMRQLKHFVAVVDYGSMNAAAAQLGITQPGLTRSIRQLEDLYDCVLLDRGRKGVSPTVYGERLYKYACAMLNESSRIKAEMSALTKGSVGQTTIGVSSNFAGLYTPDAIAMTLRKNPNNTIIVREGFFEDLTEALRNGELDFVFSLFPSYYTEPDLTFEPLLKVKSHIIGRHDHPLSHHTITREQLAEARWIFSDQKHVSNFKEAFFGGHKIPPPKNTVITKSLTLVRALLLRSDLLTVLPEQLVREDIKNRKLMRIQFPHTVLESTGGILTTRNKVLPGTAIKLAANLRTVCKAPPKLPPP